MDQVAVLMRDVTLLIGLLVLVEYLFFSAPALFKTIFGTVGPIGYLGFLFGVGGWVWVGSALVYRDSFTQGETVSVLLVLWGGMIGAMVIGHTRKESTTTTFKGQHGATPSSTSTPV